MDMPANNSKKYAIRNSNAQKIYIAGIYLRLSQEDGEQGESNSITSQRMIATTFAKMNNIAIYDEYVDDGYSGTNFDRPAFQKMINDIENGKINTVITKDLSRLGRNYIITGQYTEMYFPRKNIRYIAIDDGVDSVKGDNEIAPFKNIINEWYARDTSKKVKSAAKAKYADGQRFMATPIIGYRRSNEKNRIVPDEETAPIVKKIFELADIGWGSSRIRTFLNKNDYPTPSYISYKRSGAFAKFYEGKEKSQYPRWSDETVRRILRDETYIGNTVHYRQGTISFKDQKRIHKPKSEWAVVEHTHEPLVTKEVFDSIQSKLEFRKAKYANEEKKNIFAGVLKCADCGCNMTIGYTNSKGKRRDKIFKCLKYSHNGPSACSMHYTIYNTLYRYVLNRLQFWISNANISEDELLHWLVDTDENDGKDRHSTCMAELTKLKARLNEIDDLFIKMYEDRLNGILPDRNFEVMSKRFQSEQQDILKQVEMLSEKCKEKQDDRRRVSEWLNLVKKYTMPEELTAEMINAFIDRIEVYEREKLPNGIKTQRITIYYKFLGKEEN